MYSRYIYVYCIGYTNTSSTSLKEGCKKHKEKQHNFVFQSRGNWAKPNRYVWPANFQSSGKSSMFHVQTGAYMCMKNVHFIYEYMYLICI